MIPALIAIFGVGTAGAIVLSRTVNKPAVLLGAFVNLFILLHEMSFALFPAGNWVRVDLVLLLPAFTLASAWMACIAIRECPGPMASTLLSLAGLSAPVWFILIRDRFH